MNNAVRLLTGLLPLFLATHALRSAKTNTGVAPQITQAQFIHPGYLQTAEVNLLAGLPTGTEATISRITPGGKVLLAFSWGSVTESYPAPQVLGYIWDHGTLTPLSSPAWPWIYDELNAEDKGGIDFRITDMNDDGVVVGQCRTAGWIAGAYDLDYRETIGVIWPGGAGASPQVLNPGIISLPERYDRYQEDWAGDSNFYRTEFDSIHIDLSGRCYAVADVGVYNGWNEDWFDYRQDVVRWDNPALPPTNLTGNAALFNAGTISIEAHSQILSLSPGGHLLVANRRDSVGYLLLSPDGGSGATLSTNTGAAAPGLVTDAGMAVGFGAQFPSAWPDGPAPSLLAGYFIASDADGDLLHTTEPKLWLRRPSSEGDYYVPVIASVAVPSTTPAATRQIANGLFAGGTRQRPTLRVPARLAVDHDHDGIIFDQGGALNASQLPPPDTFRFWSNDDDDVDPDAEAATTGTDWQNNRVDGEEDLADFFPVFLDIKQLLGVLPPSATIRYKLKHAEERLNFSYTSLTRANAFAYLTDTAATYGPSANRLASANVTEQITATGVYLDTYGYDFLNGIIDQDRGVILVEMREMTAEPLRLVVEKDGVEIAELSLPLVPVQKAPDYLEANTDFDERKLVNGFVAPDSADPELAAISGTNAGTNRINDLHDGFFGLPPGVLPYARTSGATVKIRKLAKTDPVLDAPQSGEVRLHRIWGSAPAQAEHIELYDPVTLEGHNIGRLYNAAPAEAGSSYYLEGVKPGRITLEFSFQRSDLSFKFEQEFIVTTRRSRAAWLAEITDQIKVETEASGTVDMLLYATGNGFMQQKAQIQQVYRFYEGLHHRTPEVQRWGGLAKRAGCAVYGGFSDMEAILGLPDGSSLEFSILFLQSVLVRGGYDIFHDLSWQCRAYERGGYYALEFTSLNNLDTGVGFIRNVELEPWLKIAQGDLAGDSSKIIDGVFDLTNREQRFIVQPAWNMINTAPTFYVVEQLLSYFTKNPLPTEADFFAVYPLKNIALFDDRWPWVTNHMLPQWGAMSEPARNALVDDPLVNAADHYAIYPVTP